MNIQKICGLVPMLVLLAHVGPAFAQNPVKQVGAQEFAIDADEIVQTTNCRPEWPAGSIANQERGAAEVSVLVNTDGYVSRAKLVVSTGFRELDRATLKGFLGCRFGAVRKDGVPVEAWTRVRYVWWTDKVRNIYGR